MSDFCKPGGGRAPIFSENISLTIIDKLTGDESIVFISKIKQTQQIPLDYRTTNNDAGYARITTGLDDTCLESGKHLTMTRAQELFDIQNGFHPRYKMFQPPNPEEELMYLVEESAF